MHKIHTVVSGRFYLVEDWFRPEELEILDTVDVPGKSRHGAGPDHPHRWQMPVCVDHRQHIIEGLVDWTPYHNHQTSQVFEDPTGYICEPHVDNSTNMRINLQVYLTDHLADCATHAWIDGVEYQAVYGRNQGYILVDPHTTQHGMVNPVPDGHLRRSYYTSWRSTVEPHPFW